MYCTNAGDNVLTVYSRDAETGLLEDLFSLPISGVYPKDIAIFPDQQHVASLNHESGTITFFKIDYEKKQMVMSSRSIEINEPNCCALVRVR